MENNPKVNLTVDIEKQTLTIGDQANPSGKDLGGVENFEINVYKKSCLINGYDDIDFILAQKDLIEKFEKQ